MKAYRFLLAAMALLSTFGMSAQMTQRLTATKTNEYGLIYNLPKTGIVVTISATKTVETPGEFARYAKKYLNMTPILEPRTRYEMGKVEIYTRPLADDAEQYLVRFKSGQGVFMMVTADGFPVSIGDDAFTPAPAPVTSLKEVGAAPTILETPAAHQAVTEDMLRATSSAKRAELAADKIYEIRQQRSDIISGQADNMPSDGEAMKVALAALDRQEQALTAMFVGTTATSTEVKTFYYTPSADDERVHRVIARLSATDGLVGPDDLSGSPIYLDMTVTRRGELPVNEKGVVKTFPKEGVAYRIPGNADVKVTYDGRALAQAAVSVAQFGVVFGLDPAIFTAKKSPGYLHFDSNTGAILELGIFNGD